MLVLFGLQIVDRSFGPVLPLYLGEIGYPSDEIPLVAGVLFSVLAFTGALGNQLSSRLLKTFSPRQIIAAAVVSGAAALALFAISSRLWLLALTMAPVGLCIGTAVTTAFAAGGSVIPRDVHGTAFGFLTGASLIGVALSPVLSGLVAAYSIRAVFVVGIATLVLLAVVVRRVMVERTLPIDGAPAVEES
jgi:MFS family permease